MNRKLKKELSECFRAPDPREKKAFLKKIPVPRANMSSFILTQIFFIRKRIWAVSILIFAAAVLGTYIIDLNAVWLVSSLVPLLAMEVVTESGKSGACGMEELEKSARFSLKSVVMARFLILGIFNLGIMFFLSCICREAVNMPLMRSVVYLFVPYLLTAFISLRIVRQFRSREGMYGCIVTAVLVGVCNLVIHRISANIHLSGEYVCWGIAAALLALLTGVELYKMLKETEEYRWNLSLTD